MLIYYLVFFFLILRFSVTVFNFISNPKLPRAPRPYDELVSVLIPARNEAANIIRLLSSLRDQDYRDIEVIVLDDGSTDGTFELCTEFALGDKRFRVVKGEDLPDGWLGKNFACHQLASLAHGKYLLFLDADEQVFNGLLNNSIHRIKTGKLALLSLFADQEMRTLGERLVIPLMHFLLLNTLPLRLVRLSKKSSFSAASGQFMLFDAVVYRKHHWHAQVKEKVVEDIEIMKLVKAYQYRAEALLANGFLTCRMYTGFRESVNGFSKNLLAGFNNNAAGLLCYLLLVIAGPVFIAFYLDLRLLLFAVTLIILSRIMISLAGKQNVLVNVFLHPFQMAALVVIAVASVVRRSTRTVKWKGRSVNI
jgi:glycosyltransferase involved in cell wall biosynthesis